MSATAPWPVESERVIARDEYECTLAQVAVADGTSRSRVQQVESNALNKLRRVLKRELSVECIDDIAETDTYCGMAPGCSWTPNRIYDEWNGPDMEDTCCA